MPAISWRLTWPCMEGAAPPDCAWQPPTVPSVYVEYHRPSDAHQGYHVSDLNGNPGERTVVDNLEGLIKSRDRERSGRSRSPGVEIELGEGAVPGGLAEGVGAARPALAVVELHAALIRRLLVSASTERRKGAGLTMSVEGS